MAFSQTNAQRELANRKILEELQLKKQLLLKQGAVTSLNTPITTTLVSGTTGTIPFTGVPQTNLTGDAQQSSLQRSALHAAHAQSFGYFVSQDSSFGNLILPVIPRFDVKPN